MWSWSQNEIVLVKLQVKQIWRNPIFKREFVLYIPIYLFVWIFLALQQNRSVSVDLIFWLIILTSNILLVLRTSAILIGGDAIMTGHLFTRPITSKEYISSKIILLQLISGLSIMVGVLTYAILRINISIVCAVTSIYFMGTVVYPLLAIQLIYYQPIKGQTSESVNVHLFYLIPILIIPLIALHAIFGDTVDSKIMAKIWTYGLIALPGLGSICLQPLWVKGLCRIYFKRRFEMFRKAELS